VFRSNAKGQPFWKHNGWNLRSDLALLQKKTTACQVFSTKAAAGGRGEGRDRRARRLPVHGGFGGPALP